MARKRASMREGPLAELFKATEAAQEQQKQETERGKKGGKPLRAAPEPEPEREEERPAARRLAALPEPAPRLHRTPLAGEVAYLAAIRVVGVGGAGSNAVNRMIDAGVSDVEFVVVNTDVQQLAMADAPLKIHIGEQLTRGLGSGSDARPRPQGGA